MGSFEVVFVHILIQINLQGFDVGIDLLAEEDPVKFVQDGLVDPFADTIGLWTLDLGLRMLDVVELQIQLISVFIGRTAELGSTVR